MKKLVILAVAALGSVAFSACTKENVQPATHKANILADKGDLGWGDGDKGDLGQADGDKGDLGQADGGTH